MFKLRKPARTILAAALAVAVAIPAPASADQLTEANIRNAAHLWNVAELCKNPSARRMAIEFMAFIPMSEHHRVETERKAKRKALGKDRNLCATFKKDEANFRYALDNGSNDPIENPSVPYKVIRRAELNCADLNAAWKWNADAYRKLYNNCIEGEVGAYRYKVRNGLIQPE